MKKYVALLMLMVTFLLTEATVFAQEEIQSIPVSGMKVYAIDDRPNTPKPDLFPGLAQDKLLFIPTEEGSSVFRTYLVQTGDKSVLIDTGFGKTTERQGRTIDILASMNIRPEDITDILLTHLDFDHIAGLNGGTAPAFPNATVHLSEAEYEGWLVLGTARAEKSISYAKATMALYDGRIKKFEYDEEVIPGIIARDASGHTVGHTAFELGAERELVIIGDLLHVEPLQLRYPEISSIYDFDKEKAATMREFWLNRLEKSGQIVAGMHIRSIGRVTKEGEGYSITELR